MPTENNTKYYYMKLKESFFSSDEMIILEGMPDGYLYSNILLKLYLKSLKNKGKLSLNDYIPYSPTMLAQITGHSVGTVEKALHIFKELGLIEILDNGTIFMLHIQNFIGKSSTEADRIREYRQKISGEKKLLESGCTNVQQMSDKGTPEIEKEIEIEIELEKEREIEHIDYQRIANMYNEICISFPTLRALSDNRKKAIKARLNSGYTYDDFKTLFEMAECSDFLKGKNKKDWSASFDWLIKDANFAKVLEGNYSNKKKVATIENTTDNPFLKAAMEMDDND